LKKIKDALILALPPVDVQDSTLVSVIDPMSRMGTVDDGSLDSEPTEYPMLSFVDSVEPCPGNANIELNSSNNMLVARQTLTNIELREDEHDKKIQEEDMDQAAAKSVTDNCVAAYSSIGNSWLCNSRGSGTI
jgi:hypothetical protein